MKKALLFLMLMASFISYEAMSQCGRVSLIGEFNGWSDDYFMVRMAETPAQFHVIITLTEAMDTDTNGVIELKFRENADWTTNWGSDQFPTGTAVLDGPNIQVPIGSWIVMFNCETANFSFTETCGTVSMIGEFNGWADDYPMHRMHGMAEAWYTTITLTEAMDPNTDGIIELKFRENADWAMNWGSDQFPTGVAVLDGPDLPVPYGNYLVTFNCLTGEYNFQSTCGEIGLIGEFNGWSADEWMQRDMANPDLWTLVLTLTDNMDTDTNGIIELKFRQNADWGVNWGSDQFPSGIATMDGPNIMVPLDDTGLTTDYFVTFNCGTGEFSFVHTSGMISMIGAFNNWDGDIPMNRDAENPHLWTLSRSWFADSEVKFRENKDWSLNWGNNTFPTGTGEDNGPNIPLTAGKYDVTFNTETLEYSFIPNNDICGEIGMIGDFNEFGAGDPPSDVWMVRDPMFPSNFSIEYNFTSSTQFLFRMDGDPTYTNVWGLPTFPEGTGVMDPSVLYNVPGGKYMIYFNCLSGDYSFVRLGNAVTAPKVFAMTIDGILDEADWNIDQPVSQVIQGTPGDDLNEVYFGVTYNDEYLFVGIDIKDTSLSALGGDMGEIFIDGNKSGGPFDDYDLHMRFVGPVPVIIHGPDDIEVMLNFSLNADGYSAEVAIPWEPLMIVPAEGDQIGLDIIVGDNDNQGADPEYLLAWNGGLQNYVGTSAFGDMLFGNLSCGCISVYNDVIGDVVLRNPTDQPTQYVGTYELFEDQSVHFRKDMQSAVAWGEDVFPSGTATVGGDAIPATTGRYRVNFNCVTGEYTFSEDPTPAAGIAYAEYTTETVTIDGDLSEYTLNYGSDILADGTGPNNNAVAWGSRWDENNLYFGVQVTDAVVQGSGNPWDSDAIEYYIDGNHDQDGTYDGDFDTQLIQDAASNTDVDTALWAKADGVAITDWDAKWVLTDDGYNVELRLGWSNFSFYPGKGRSIGFSLGNNDSDVTAGTRDYQTVWYGTASNWSNTGDLGDLQLAGGPYYFGVDEIVDQSAFVVLFPNPANSNVYLRLANDVFNGNVTVYVTDISGRMVQTDRLNFRGASDQILLNVDQYSPGIYFVNILGDNGTRAVKKLIVQ